MTVNSALDLFLSDGSRGLTRPEIEESWARSLDAGVDPDRLSVPEAEFDADTLLIRLGERVIDSSASLFVGDVGSVAIVDSHGTLTWSWNSDDALRRQLANVNVELGHRFVEPGVGTNGVGLSLSLRAPAIVVGAEHFKQAWHPFTCAAAPIVHPVTQQYYGSVNVCCRAGDTNRFVIAAAVALAERLRSSLQDAATPRQRRLVDAHRIFRTQTRSSVVAIDGEILITGDNAPSQLPDRATLWAILKESGPATTSVTLPGGATARVRPVNPQRFDDGCLLLFDESARAKSANPLDLAEASVIRNVLAQCDGNKAAAAQVLGMSRGTLYSRIRRYKL